MTSLTAKFVINDKVLIYVQHGESAPFWSIGRESWLPSFISLGGWICLSSFFYLVMWWDRSRSRGMVFAANYQEKSIELRRDTRCGKSVPVFMNVRWVLTHRPSLRSFAYFCGTIVDPLCIVL